MEARPCPAPQAAWQERGNGQGWGPTHLSTQTRAGAAVRASRRSGEKAPRRDEGSSLESLQAEPGDGNRQGSALAACWEFRKDLSRAQAVRAGAQGAGRAPG